MSFNKKTIRDIDLNGKAVLLRADYNVPLTDDGQIADDYRISKSLPTIKYLLEQNCKIIVCSHLGRPEGHPEPKFSLAPVAKRLDALLNIEVQFAKDCVGVETEKLAKALQPGQILLLENLRFHAEEEANNPDFAKKLASLAEVFVQDGFGVVHRAHASTEAVTKFLPSIAGLLLEKEVDTITNVMENPARPLMAIIGGAKIADKIEVLNRLVDIADFVAVGGAMANTFLKSEGIEIGQSKSEPSDLDLAKQIIDKAKAKSKDQRFTFYLPQDGVVAKTVDKQAKTRIVDWSAHAISDIESYPQRPSIAATQVQADESILDVGPFSGAFIAGGMQLAGTVIWNGTMGVTEVESLQGPIGPFAHGTEMVVEAMIGEFGHKPFTLVGGGDTAAYIEERKMVEYFNHVSTGGGASMELLAGKSLPGVDALINKDQ